MSIFSNSSVIVKVDNRTLYLNPPNSDRKFTVCFAHALRTVYKSFDDFQSAMNYVQHGKILV